jgi:sulfide dehydrogenase [flavocytochrome c] flavoprotein subunit
MSSINRREFIRAAGAVSLLGVCGGWPLAALSAKAKARVVVVGGGYGGAVAAKYIKLMDPDIQVRLIERDKQFVSCPLSNEVLSGDRDLDTLTFNYKGLAKRGVTVVRDEVVSVDPARKSLKGKSGDLYKYDKLVLSPGVDFRWEAIEGYDAKVAERIPHAWKAGPQTLTLRKQLKSMKDGGVVYIVAPPNPFRCPPGPYERAAQIAHYLKQSKPKSKVVILDAKDKFSKQKLFMTGWEKFYGNMIEWVSGAEGGIVEAVEPGKMELVATVENFKGDVINLIPPQKAAQIAVAAGVTDQTGWCPVDPRTFESTLHKNVHVIGDSCVAGAMPKSGYAANTQAKVCAAAIVAEVNGLEVPEPSYVNTCYSIIAPDYGISVAAVYGLADGKIAKIEESGGLSPSDTSKRFRTKEAENARSWIRNIMADTFT